MVKDLTFNTVLIILTAITFVFPYSANISYLSITNCIKPKVLDYTMNRELPFSP